MKGRAVHLDHVHGRPAAALLVDGRLDDLFVSAPDDTPGPGAIFRAVVDRPLKGQGGVILRLPDARAYLRGAKGLREGESLMVQVTGYAEAGKAIPVTNRPLYKSRHVIVTPGSPGYNVSRTIRDDERREALLSLAHDIAGPPGDVGMILRSKAEHASDEEVAQDIAATLDLAGKVSGDHGEGAERLFDGPDPHMLAWRDWEEPDAIFTDPGNFAVHGILERIAELREPRVDLPGGAWMAIEPTRALVAVDVNTGADTSLAAGLKANIAMARSLPAQLRCRGLGGQITLDVAPMPRKERRQFEQILGAALRRDSVDTMLAGWTPLGLFELQRKRERLPLSMLGTI